MNWVLLNEFIDWIVQENQELESELARLELHKQDLDDEVKVLANVGKEIPQVCLFIPFFILLVTRTRESVIAWSWEIQSYYWWDKSFNCKW